MTSSTEKVETMPPELAQIAAEALAIEPPPAADPNNPEAPPVVVNFQEDAAMLVEMLFEGAGEIYPSTGDILKPKQTRFTNALGKLMHKHNWSIAAILGRWGAEIEFAFVASTMAVPLAKAIQHDRAVAKAKKAQEEAVTQPADPQPARPAVDPYSTAFQADAENRN
jgi:hypothetical protein